MRHLKNVSIAQFEAFLDLVHCKELKGKGGHNKWTRSDLLRPIIFQSHIDPLPEFIVKNNLRVLGYSKDNFFDILEFKVKVQKVQETYQIVKNNA
jgi:hypothetical protein